MESTEKTSSTIYELGIETELRVITGEEKRVSLELLNGYAEIFGSELSQNTTYTFSPNSRVSVYSWQGCSIKLSGEAVESSVSQNSWIMLPVNIHACLEQKRKIAESNIEKGPVSLVVGSMLSGKSAFCRFLLNYAARMGRSPLYVDLDVRQNRSLIPGTISMIKINQPSHVTEGFSRKAVCSFLFGYTHPKSNILLYYSLIKKLGGEVQKRLCKENANMYNSGIIIDTFSWIKKKKGYDTIAFTVNAFSVDIIFVINNKKLFLKLTKDMPSSVKIVFIPKQEREIEYNQKQEEHTQQNLISQYFYGSIQNPLTPYIFDVKFSDIRILVAQKCKNLNDIDIRNIDIFQVSLRSELVNSILGLSFAENINANLLATSIKYYICVIGIDIIHNVITVLSPQPGPLPNKILIYGHIKFNKKYQKICK